MSIPTYDQAWASAREGSPFSNSGEGECWMANNCHRCVNDNPDDGEGCDLVLVALLGRTPVEWTPNRPGSLGEQYRCMYFRDEEDGHGGDPEPHPIPDPPGQLTIAPREPFEASRMLTEYPQPVGVS